MDDLRDLAVFVAVAELRSFTAAAARLGMPVSTVSRRIVALEAALHVPLFIRTTRRVELTEAGAIYLAGGRTIVEAAAEIRRQLRGVADAPQGVLRLSVEADIGARLVAPVLAAYVECFPAVRVQLDLSPRRVDLVGENFDVAVRIGTLPDSGLTVRRIASLPGALYAAPAYLDRRGMPASPADLENHARIHLLHQGDRGSWLLSRRREQVEIAGPGLITANNMTMIRHLVGLGVGIAVLDALMAAEDMALDRVQPVLPDWSLPAAPVSILTPTRHLPAKSRLFVDMLANALEGSTLGPATASP